MATSSRSLRPIGRSIQCISTSTSCSLSHTTTRHQSTTRRMTKALRLKPSADHNKASPHDHIIFNPPSSLPNIYHTPLKFLPKTDPRRALRSQSSKLSSAPFQNPSGTRSMLPPPTRTPYTKKYHLTPEDVEQIRKLRTEDPLHWTRDRLAEKFNCSQMFIAIVVQSPAGQEIQRKRVAEAQARWGPKKREAREDRARRRALWGRDA